MNLMSTFGAISYLNSLSQNIARHTEPPTARPCNKELDLWPQWHSVYHTGHDCLQLRLKRIRIGDSFLPDAASIPKEVLRHSFGPVTHLERRLHAYSLTDDQQQDNDAIVCYCLELVQICPPPQARVSRISSAYAQTAGS